MAEIEDLARDLKTQVARYGLLTEIQPTAAGPAHEAAMLQRYETLGEIAATALGIETACRKEQLRKGPATEHALMIRTAPARKEGPAQ